MLNLILFAIHLLRTHSITGEHFVMVIQMELFSVDSASAYSGSLGLEMDLTSISPPSNTCALTSCAVNLQQGKFYMISF